MNKPLFWPVLPALVFATPLFAQTPVAAPQPVLSWTFDELKDNAFAEAGAEAGSAEFAAKVSGVTQDTGLHGKAAKFDGATSKMDIPGLWSQKLPNGFSISLWVKPELSAADGYGLILNNNPPKGFVFRTVYGGKSLSVGGNKEWHIARMNLKDLTGKWVHLALTCEGSKMRVYLEGAVLGERDEPTVKYELSHETILGYRVVETKGIKSETEFFKGLVDNFQVFDRALTSDEVRAIYDAQKG